MKGFVTADVDFLNEVAAVDICCPIVVHTGNGECTLCRQLELNHLVNNVFRCKICFPFH
jgi:hypothetical protein